MIDRKPSNEELEAGDRGARIQKILRTFRNINRLIARETDRARLIQSACSCLTGDLGFHTAWIGILDESGQAMLETGSSGFGGEFDKIRAPLCQGRFMENLAHVLSHDDVQVVSNPLADCPDCPLAMAYTGRSGMARRLRFGDQVFGILSVSVPAPYAHNHEEQSLFRELTDDLAFGLYTINIQHQIHQLNHIVQSVPHPMSLISRDYRYMAVNQAYTRFYRSHTDRIIGKTPSDFCGPAVFEKEIKPYLDRCLAGETIEYEVLVDFPELGRRWMRMEYFPYRDEQGEIAGVVSHGRDITEQTVNDMTLATIIENAPVGICITDPDGMFELVNPAYCRIYDYTALELLGRHFTLVVPDSQKDQLNIAHDRFIEQGYEIDGEWSVLDKSGRSLSIMARAARITGSDNRFRKVTFVIDITDKKRLEQLRTDADRIMKHDLRQPLAGIMALPGVLRNKGPLNTDQERILTLMELSGERMYRMINFSFDLYKIETNEYDYAPEPVDLLKIIHEVREHNQKRLSQKNLTFRLEKNHAPVRPGEAFFVMSDEQLLYPVVSNLIVNAIDASPPEEEIRVTLTVSDAVNLTIRNIGAVPASIRSRFFEKYQTYGKKGGTGLGTYGARQMALAMGYDITMTTIDEKNTTLVCIHIPNDTGGLKKK